MDLVQHFIPVLHIHVDPWKLAHFHGNDRYVTTVDKIQITERSESNVSEKKGNGEDLSARGSVNRGLVNRGFTESITNGSHNTYQRKDHITISIIKWK